MQTLGLVRFNTRYKWPAQIVEMELEFFVFHFNEFTAFGRSQFLDSAGWFDDARVAHRFAYPNFHKLPLKQPMDPISSGKSMDIKQKILTNN